MSVLELLWGVGLFNRCPQCWKPMLGHGYRSEWGLMYWCDRCGWGKTT